MPTTPINVRSQETEAVTVFKFANIYDPANKPPKPNDEIRVVEDSDVDSSPFSEAIDGITDPDAKADAILDAINGFTPISTIGGVRDIDPGLYTLGGKLPKLNGKTTDEKLAEWTSGLTPLSSGELRTIWDNLYYYALTAKNVKLAEALIMLLRANAFLLEYNEQKANTDPTEEEEHDYLNRLILLAGARAVIPHQLVAMAEVEQKREVEEVNADTRDLLNRMSESAIAKDEIEMYERVIKKLECAERVHQIENSKKFDIDYKTHLAGLDPESEEPAEPFVFEAIDPFGEDFIEEFIEPDSELTNILNLKRCGATQTLGDLAGKMRSRQADAYQRMFDNAPKQRKAVLYNGTVVQEPRNLEPQRYMLVAEPIVGTELHRLYLTLNRRPDNAPLVAISLTMTEAPNTVFAQQDNIPSRSTDDGVTYRFFEDGLDLSNGPFDFNMSFRAKKGDAKYDVDSAENYEPMQKRVATHGPESKGNWPTSAYEGMTLHGVKRMGVLEYKKVDQTICCYVAGEVSNIENVMAREYREKISRSLNRSEVSQEDTSEKEVENLRDTVTTDRYELQTEIAQMLQEEESLQVGTSVGANTNYTAPGNMFTAGVNMNAFLNFSSGSSSTNSTNTTETIAKEVMERALQRIVEKTISKRTSRMLREYEETNTHGFDNRLGDKHVTGIYRWVDKIYENKLYNYGKRLLYEFMIPEPSLNFKKWMTAGVLNDTPSISPPIPLDSFNLIKNGSPDWSMVNTLNYANAAAAYGADVNAPLPIFISIEKSYAETIQGADEDGKIRAAGFSYEMKIPDGYQCQFIKSVIYATRDMAGNGSGVIPVIMASIGTSDLLGYQNWVHENKMTYWTDLGSKISDNLGVAVIASERFGSDFKLRI